MSYNLPMLSIPAFYVLALIPHVVGSAIAGRVKALDPTNPGGSTVQEQVKKKVSAAEYARYERCKSCHRNHIENLPFYAITILAGLYAERESGQQLGLTAFAASFLIVRVLYTVNYISVSTKTWSYVRSLLYTVGVGLCFTMIVRSAKALGASS